MDITKATKLIKGDLVKYQDNPITIKLLEKEGWKQDKPEPVKKEPVKKAKK